MNYCHNQNESTENLTYLRQIGTQVTKMRVALLTFKEIRVIWHFVPVLLYEVGEVYFILLLQLPHTSLW